MTVRRLYSVMTLLKITGDYLKLPKTLKAAQFGRVNCSGPIGDHIAERVGSIIAAQALLVGIGFEDISGLVGIGLEKGEAIEEAAAPLVDEEAGFDAGIGVTESAVDFGPAKGAVGVGATETDSQSAELRGES